MKILIVCIQGLTSGILAKRMTDISHDHGDGHEFRACSQFDLDQYQEWADVILLTTQVRSIAKNTEEKYAEKKILVISQESMSFNQVSETYAQILHQISKKDSIQLTWKTFFNILKNIFLLCTIICIPGWLAWAFLQVSGISLLKAVYESTAKIICLYGACITGYYYAKEMDESKIAYMLMGFMALLALSPGLNTGSITIAEAQEAFIRLPDYNFLFLFLYIPCVFFFLFCYQKISAFIKDHIYRKDIVLGEFNLGFFTMSGTAEIFLLLIVRMLLKLVY